jgi:hypothetical protein
MLFTVVTLERDALCCAFLSYLANISDPKNLRPVLIHYFEDAKNSISYVKF